MNTEIPFGLIYPSVHLLLRASKLAAPVSSRRKLLPRSIHPISIRSFSVLFFLRTDEMSSGFTSRHCREKRASFLVDERTSAADLQHAGSDSPVSSLLLISQKQAGSRAEEISSVFGSAVLKGPLMVNDAPGTGSERKRFSLAPPRGHHYLVVFIKQTRR